MTREPAATDREASGVELLIVPLVYNVAAIVLAVWAPAAARRSASRGNVRAQRDYGCYVTTVVLSLTVVPLLACFALYVFWEFGAFAFPIWVVFAWPGMLALLLRVVTEAVMNAVAVPAPDAGSPQG